MRGPPSSETRGRRGIYITAFSENEPKAVTEDGLKWEGTKAFGHDAVNVHLIMHKGSSDQYQVIRHIVTEFEDENFFGVSALLYVCFYILRIVWGISLVGQRLRIYLAMQKTWVSSLVRELGSHMPQGN